jgi:hypothetical protein
MYNHHGVFHKNSEKKQQKYRFCNALHAKTAKAAGLKFSVSIPITIKELLKKRLIDNCSGTRVIAIFKSVFFGDGALIYLRPL